ECNIPLMGRKCACGAKAIEISLLKPYDIRPALEYDRNLLIKLLSERFGIDEIPEIVLFNKTGGTDRNDLIIINGERFGWLSFDPYNRKFSIELTQGALPYILPKIKTGIVDITEYIRETGRKRLGGKNIPFNSELNDGFVVIKAGKRWGVGNLNNGKLKIKTLGVIEEKEFKNPDQDEVIKKNKRHLKNLERNAIRLIRSYMDEDTPVNVSFSGGKDSTVVLELAHRAGVEDVYHVDTGMEFPETVDFVRETGIKKILKGADFWREVRTHDLPRKDDRWCCEKLKLQPVKEWLKNKGRCVTVQGNRWYESFSRLNLPAASKNPYNSKQLNLSPIRNWRAFEVFLYIWWRELPYNPLYDKGFERIGCWNCPAMLESEAERNLELHPELFGKWQNHLKRWARQNKLQEDYVRCGLWRWKELPPKMKELARVHNIKLKERPPKQIRRSLQ
ncbi:MAG: phosphoadenosine phosphosulfate reductase family protein, partial [Methanogenium sp.]|nr:phosphoadenosine phosphosulfate reductase family protein [Methanogenium sp.]